jgi:N utilization substance protein B
MGDRRQARELALQALFFLDMDKSDFSQGFEIFCTNYEDKLTENIRPFFTDLVQGVMENRQRIDELLDTCSTNWKLARMPAVDRNIMRIAAFELLMCPDIPFSVTINEAVEIGKKYGTRDSGAFINGVLDRVKSLEGLEKS